MGNKVLSLALYEQNLKQKCLLFLLYYYYFFTVLLTLLSACCVYIVLLYCVATSTAAAKITDQPGDGSMEKLYLLNPENSKTFLILFQPKMCKNACLFPRAHFVGATCAPTEPVYESFLKSPLLPWPSLWQY